MTQTTTHNITTDDFEYSDDNVQVVCFNDEETCVQLIEEAAAMQQNGTMPAKTLPIGDLSEGTFSMINGTDVANGTLDFLE